MYRAQEQAFEDETDDERNCSGYQYSYKRIDMYEKQQEIVRYISSQHVDLTMGKRDDALNRVDQCQANGDKSVDETDRQAIP